ncbi:ATP-binding cassette domain-containing protein [Streptomyces sp. ms191]|uniref:ATP-binding cassette domain-containing protein n=1 Tax=unclassified Streptomyces TaxID=2593676 RepID=UPI0011CDDFF7|nr:ATP-binding cassette domain-containing protein [Streptomyces sp. ms191]TXS29016.1 ATP-binding cassette domain-containing protein [Streptomyces sp. ms191]
MSVEIALRRARVRHGPLEALHGLDLLVPRATVTVLTGRNGAGRTTTLCALAGTVPLASGRVLWRGADVTGLHAHARARRGLCFVPDLRGVYPSLTVAENLGLAPGDPAAALAAYPELGPLLARPAGTLSGGERRMLEVSRALLTPATVVLVDEPALGMSPAVAARTYRLLAALAREGGAAVVLAEQRLPAGLPDGTLVHELRRGSLVSSREAAELTGR